MMNQEAHEREQESHSGREPTQQPAIDRSAEEADYDSEKDRVQDGCGQAHPDQHDDGRGQDEQHPSERGPLWYRVHDLPSFLAGLRWGGPRSTYSVTCVEGKFSEVACPSAPAGAAALPPLPYAS
jgi:hypothetical protein